MSVETPPSQVEPPNNDSGGGINLFLLLGLILLYRIRHIPTGIRT